MFSKLLPVGSPAPAFILPDQDGKLFDLDRHRNRNVVLIFYPADETPVCRAQLCEVRDRRPLVEQGNAIVVGINPGGAGSHQRFREKHGFPFPLLVDPGRRVAKLYHAGGWLLIRRTVYLVGADGSIRFARRGKPALEEVLAAAPPVL